eukprot:CAMPEP_0118648626 /NCGR_PEP_ID=MMETSP0785-20121206/9260_1 /TAXON_ID=91992 /ORGANISM="Bolidomonas pacifica, Strain CCMP 1866" /LENGTH=511 /DNA_ID=CAMNT_0006540839 /DNA_START=33 /DNA_END=1565 /DNA_ORIENTATION=-
MDGKSTIGENAPSSTTSVTTPVTTSATTQPTSTSAPTATTSPSTKGKGSGPKKSKRDGAPWDAKNKKKKQRKNTKNAEEDRKNYESRSKGYAMKGEDGEVLDGNAPHPGSYAYETYLQNKRKKEEGEGEGKDPVSDSAPDSNRKYPKRKLAFLVGFCGKNYQGMQMNNNSKSIQAELEKAFFESELLSEANYGYPKKCGWSNSARTDKGVHAAAQVISARLNVPTPDEDLSSLREIINSNLPSDIKVLDIKKCTKGFCAKTCRDKVRYQYMVPTYCLRSDLKEAFDKHMPTKDRGSFENLDKGVVEAIQKEMREHRTDEATLDKVRDVFGKYKGTKKYHNYTNRLSYTDASASRYMLDFSPVSEGCVYSPDGMEWIGVRVTGQAFLLHQIRKMVSMAVDVIRGGATEDAMDKSFGKGKMRLSIAPSQGLFLDMSYFDLYCERPDFKYSKLRWGDDTDTSPATQRWSEFKRVHIVDHILSEEEKELNFLTYMYNQIYFFPKGEDAYVLFEGM